MRILYVSQYFPPEMGAPSGRVHELSREWVHLGHDVTVLTGFAHHPKGVKALRDQGVLTRREKVDGIDVLRTYVFAAPNKGLVKRMLSYASFMASAMTIGRFRVTRPDVVIATSPQLLCGLAGYVLARTLRVPFVFEVRDLWPEGIQAVELMKENVLIKGLKRLANFLYLRCDKIVTVGEGYRRGIHTLYGITEDKMAIIPNGVDTNLFTPLPRDNQVRKEFGWGDRFILLYIGTHGMTQGLCYIMEAAKSLRNDLDKLFVFVGEGAEKDNLKSLALEWELTNVQFIDQQPKNRVPLFYAACDVGLITLRKNALLQESLPSKLFEYLGMERPVLLSVGGEARRLLENASAGDYVPPEDVASLVEAIRCYSAKGRDSLAEIGRKGRGYVLLHYNRHTLAKRYLDILVEVCARSER